ncbi:MAG TPA: histidine kinase N-terminal domain-containing protein [Frankiaceae bacterium]|nr:histidine kinase N-terminal domain-containing protein [Frankiaceae bacterium]
MTALADLLAGSTGLDGAGRQRLQALVTEWGLLADLSFADLLLCVPVDAEAEDPSFLVVAQVRPATGPTVHPTDLFGTTLRRDSLSTAWRERRIVREGEPEYEDGVPVRVEAIPIPPRAGGFAAQPIAVLARDTNLVATRWPSPLEVTYLRSANDLALMVADGSFPFPPTDIAALEAPRVGDGILRLDETGLVSYASPNAVSSYRRLGHNGNLTGERLRDVHLGLPLEGSFPERRGVDAATRQRLPQEDELEVDGVVVVLRAIPLLSGAEHGALVLVRDVTELRRREAQLLSKDATIREIHHRVKNNLQTVAALLRLQSRRMKQTEASEALQESVRRVTSIALVHEILSQSLEETVAFDAIADQLGKMTLEVATTGGRPSIRRIGSFGTLPGQVATPLSLVLSELLQNAVEHGAAEHIRLYVRREGDALEMRVVDDGKGLPADFDPERSDRLGLQIVRSLAIGEMRGTFALHQPEPDPSTAPGQGAEAVVRVPSVEIIRQ